MSEDISNDVAKGVLKAVAVVAAIALGIVLVLMVMTSNDDLGCASRNADRATNGQSTEDC